MLFDQKAQRGVLCFDLGLNPKPSPCDSQGQPCDVQACDPQLQAANKLLPPKQATAAAAASSAAQSASQTAAPAGECGGPHQLAGFDRLRVLAVMLLLCSLPPLPPPPPHTHFLLVLPFSFIACALLLSEGSSMLSHAYMLQPRIIGSPKSCI